MDKSIIVSAPHLQAQTAFSTSSPILDVTAELPILALILTRKFVPIIIGSASEWFMFAGIIALPDAISSLTNSGVIGFIGICELNCSPG